MLREKGEGCDYIQCMQPQPARDRLQVGGGQFFFVLVPYPKRPGKMFSQSNTRMCSESKIPCSHAWEQVLTWRFVRQARIRRAACSFTPRFSVFLTSFSE